MENQIRNSNPPETRQTLEGLLAAGYSRKQAIEMIGSALIYDTTIMGDNNALPTERITSVGVPTIVIDDGASPAWMRHAVQAVVDALPNAPRRTLEGQTHDVAPDALAPVLEEFFANWNESFDKLAEVLDTLGSWL